MIKDYILDTRHHTIANDGDICGRSVEETLFEAGAGHGRGHAPVASMLDQVESIAKLRQCHDDSENEDNEEFAQLSFTKVYSLKLSICVGEENVLKSCGSHNYSCGHLPRTRSAAKIVFRKVNSFMIKDIYIKAS